MAGQTNDRLDSWKEIASYLKRGVRTVRRWEQEEGLPIHRHVHRVLGSVYAYKSEIEDWRTTGRHRWGPPRKGGGDRHAAASRHAKSIAVLPFKNLSSDPENEYFADGLTDEVTAALARLATLRVISRTSAMTFKGSAKQAAAIARDLNVRYILEGSVRRSGQRLRITAELVDARRDEHLWADRIDGTLEDVFAIQERLARVIVDALKLRLTENEDRRLAERPIASVHAYECYLRARHQAWRWRQDAIDHAIQLLNNGLAIVGDNARLHATLGLTYLQYREAGIDFGERPIMEAEACARKAQALEPVSASSHMLHGWICYCRGRIQQSVRALKSALEDERNNADALMLLANCYLISGRVSAARPIIDCVLKIDPLTPVNRCMPAFADMMDGRFEAAVGPYRQMFEMDPGNPMARLFYVWALVLNDRRQEIRKIADGYPADVRGTVPARMAAFLMHAVARNQEAMRLAVVPQVEQAAMANDVFSRILAQGYALAGLPEPALRWLAVAVERGFVNYPFLAQHDPSLAGLRSLPRFQRLMKDVRGRWEAFEA